LTRLNRPNDGEESPPEYTWHDPIETFALATFVFSRNEMQ
jgi:hypothetical protein